MSHFALLRQRIKVIQSIQKTTSAMRLIAMSIQGKLNKKELAFKSYTELLAQVHAAYQAQQVAPSAVASISEESIASTQRIVVIVGSQKTLCGSFNEKLWAYIMAEQPQLLRAPCITVGTHATKLAQQHNVPLHTTYDELSSATFIKVAQKLTQLIQDSSWRQIIVLSNTQRTFFIQLPEKHVLTIPVQPATAQSQQSNNHAVELAGYLTMLHIQSKLIQILQSSLLAEQAARFLSMDTATRNADELLHRTRLAYNKARQTYVTRELIELTSSYNAD